MSGNDLYQAQMKIQSLGECDSKDMRDFYNNWAEDFEKDFNTLSYQAPKLAADLILSHFTGSPAEAQVLDVACGPGMFAKVMKEYGFGQFSGVDFSERMLMEAGKTGLYQELKQANLGTDPLPGHADSYDVVAMISALPPDHVPLSVFKELCHVSKPGGLICMSKANRLGADTDLTTTLEKELQLLEDAGLWLKVEFKKCDRYILGSPEADEEEPRDAEFMSGTLYLLRKPPKDLNM